MSAGQQVRSATQGFTLIEVLVALVIVAFGMGALLAALSGSATNVAALREKTLAQWIALNRIADVRLNLQPPQMGTSEGDVKNFANGDWHWQQIVTNVQQIPGLVQVTVKVRRTSINTGSSGGSRTPSGTGSSRSTIKEPDWITTVIGFRGTTLAAASGEVPTWSGANNVTASGSSSSGGIANPGTSRTPGTATTPATTIGTTSGSGSSLSSPGNSSPGGN
ncbi:MAG: type II secretion system minor pseudopilin GspI [Steroidobacteraceae bacterium]